MRIKASLLLILSLLLFSCSKDEGPDLSSENKILSFKITSNGDAFNGVINEQSKTITLTTVALETNSTLVPEISISQNATISPNPSSAQDFSQNITYVVTAENGEQTTYTVITNNTPIASEKKILSFQLNIDDEVFDGVINHASLTIEIETDKNPSYVSPIIMISDGATISPNSSEPQNFNSDIQYTVTAEDETSNVYTVMTKWISFNSVNSAISTSDIATRYYSNATPYVRTTYVDLSIPNSNIILENDANSYEIEPYNYTTYENNDLLNTSFQFEFPTDIVTAIDYKLKYIVDGQVKSVSPFNLDVLSENAPEIISSNQTNYSYNDTLILTGNNLLPGLRIVAHNGLIYQFNESSVSVNDDGTELTLLLDTNINMFPSWVGGTSPSETPLIMYYNARNGQTLVVDFN